MSGGDRLRRAFLIVLALRYLPTGLFLPVFVLVMLDRGLSLAEVGLAGAVMGVVVLVAEIPTGGLADVVGARAVLLAAAVLDVVGFAMVAFADDVAGFVLAAFVRGLNRALDSGPLEAWFVDSVLAVEPGRDLAGDLSRAGVVTYSALAGGALLTPLTALLPPTAGSSAATAVVGAAAAGVVHLLSVFVLVRGPAPDPRQARRVLDGLRDTRAAVGLGLRTAWTSRPLRLVLLVELGWSAGLVAVEQLWQPRLGEVVGIDPVRVTGYVAATGLAAGALASAALPALIRALRGRLALTAAVLLGCQAAAVIVLGLGGAVGVIAAYIGFYGLHGPLNSAHSALLHQRTPSGRRATVLSVNSLVGGLGAVLAGPALGALADVRLGWALLVAAGLLALSALLYLWSGEDHGAADVAA